METKQKYIELNDRYKELYLLYQNKPTWWNGFRLKRAISRIRKIEKSIPKRTTSNGNYPMHE